MYDKDHLDGMTEETPINPPSKKGQVRNKIANMIMEAVDKGDITALIARSADFYGPSIKNTSILTETVFNPLSNGKKANWMSSVDYKHSFTYTPDAGKLQPYWETQMPITRSGIYPQPQILLPVKNG